MIRWRQVSDPLQQKVNQVHYSSLVERVGGESVDVWAIHYEARKRQRDGEDIIILSVGEESDQNTPIAVQQAAIDSISSGRHHYTSVLGDERLRGIIAEKHRERTGQSVTADNVAVFSGAQNALFATSLCLLEHGDEVIVPEPYYATYPASVRLGGATMVSVPTDVGSGFTISIEGLESALTDRTRAVLLNSPNNPTGAVYSRRLLQAIVDLCRSREIWLVSDEVYAEIAPEDFVSIGGLDGAGDICVTISSVSKSHRMTGWRCGWTIAPRTLNRHFYNLNMCMAYGLPPFIQDAAAHALETDSQTAHRVRERLSRNRQILAEELANLGTARLHTDGGGMFAVLDVRNLGVSSTEFAWGLLASQDVSLLPCDGFGSSGQGLVRISLCLNDDVMGTAARRIAAHIKQLLA